MLHDEVDNASFLSTAEAVVSPRVDVDVEARGFFPMKRTQTDMAAPTARQSHRVADDRDDVGPLPDHFDRFLQSHVRNRQFMDEDYLPRDRHRR